MYRYKVLRSLCLAAAVFACVVTLSQNLPHPSSRVTIQDVSPESYAVYSALLNQKYQFWFKQKVTVPIYIASFTEPPDRNHGVLIGRCLDGAKDDVDRDMVRRLMSESAQKRRIQSKINLPRPYLITDKSVQIKEGKEPGMIWLSNVVFSKDGRRALVWVRNFCGGLCGSGILSKLNRTDHGWKVDDRWLGCGFIS